MSNIVYPNTFSNGTPADATQVNGNFNEVSSVVNGNIDDSNIKANAGIATSKIAGTAPYSDFPCYNRVSQHYLESISSRYNGFTPYTYFMECKY